MRRAERGQRRATVMATVAAAASVLGGVVAARPAAMRAEPVVSLRLPGADTANVSLAARGEQVVVAWAARAPSATDVYAAWSADGGATFGPPARVNDVPGAARVSGEQAPRVVLGKEASVVWVSRKEGASLVRVASARPGGTGFAPARTVAGEGVPGLRGWPSAAVDGTGALHVAWLDTRGDAPGGGGGEHAGHAAEGHHAMRQDLFAATWRAGGGGDEVRVATGVCFCCKTAVATGADGSVYLAWRHVYAPNLRDMAVARSRDGGRTFGPPVRVSQDGWAIDACPEDGPALAVDARGIVHIAWPTMTASGTKGIFYSDSADGGATFAPRLRVDDGSGTAAHPQIAAGGVGVAVAWDQGGTVYVRQVAAPTPGTDAARLGPIRAASGVAGPAGRATYPAVTFAGDSLIVAWTEQASGSSEVRVRRMTPSDGGSARSE